MKYIITSIILTVVLCFSIHYNSPEEHEKRIRQIETDAMRKAYADPEYRKRQQKYSEEINEAIKNLEELTK